MTFDGSQFIAASNEAYDPREIKIGDAQPLGTDLHNRVASNSRRIERGFDRCGLHLLTRVDGDDVYGRPMVSEQQDDGKARSGVHWLVFPMRFARDVNKLTISLAADFRVLAPVDPTETVTLSFFVRIIGQGGEFIFSKEFTEEVDSYRVVDLSVGVDDGADEFLSLRQDDFVTVLVGIDQCETKEAGQNFNVEAIESAAPTVGRTETSGFKFLDLGDAPDQPQFTDLNGAPPYQLDVVAFDNLPDGDDFVRNPIFQYNYEGAFFTAVADEHRIKLYGRRSFGVLDNRVRWISFAQVRSVLVTVDYLPDRIVDVPAMRSRIPEKAAVMRSHMVTNDSQYRRRRLLAIGSGGRYNDEDSDDRWPVDYRQISTFAEGDAGVSEILTRGLPAVPGLNFIEINAVFMPIFFEPDGSAAGREVTSIDEVQDLAAVQSWNVELILEQFQDGDPFPVEVGSATFTEGQAMVVGHYPASTSTLVAPFFIGERHRKEQSVTTGNKFTYREGMLQRGDVGLFTVRSFIVSTDELFDDERPFTLKMDCETLGGGADADFRRLVLIGYSIYGVRS